MSPTLGFSDSYTLDKLCSADMIARMKE